MIYVAGPMTGLPKLNYPKFRRVTARLRCQGWDVVSPVEIGETMGLRGDSPDKQDAALLRHVIDAELRALRSCDAIYLMDGWERSKGTLQELIIAVSYHLEIVLEHRGKSMR